MRRRALYALISVGGVMLAAVLIVAGALLLWANSFVDSNVYSQLAAQKIYFPANGSAVLASDPEIRRYVTPYAGQQVINGQQAEVFADHYIAVQLREVDGGKTYGQLAAESRAQPKNTALAARVQAAFRDEILSRLLLNVYAFWKMGQMAFWGAIASSIGAALMLLSLFGFLHLRQVPPEAEFSPACAADTASSTPQDRDLSGQIGIHEKSSAGVRRCALSS